MKALALVVLVGVLLGAGCTTIRVHEKRPHDQDLYATEKLKGIPFYAKTEAFKQSTTYEQAWWQITLTIAEVDPQSGETKGKPRSETVWVPDSSTKACEDPESAPEPCPTRPLIEELKRMVARTRPLTEEEVAELEEALRGLPPFPGAESVVLTTISNTIETILVVDYKRELYLNAPLPVFGSGSLTAKTASDGTLSEASATADTKVAEAVASLIPLKEFLTAQYVPAAATEVAEEEVKLAAGKEVPMTLSLVDIPLFKPSLTIERVGYVYEFTATYPTDPRFENDDCANIPDPCVWPGCLTQGSVTGQQRILAAPKGSMVSPASQASTPLTQQIRSSCKLRPIPPDFTNGVYTRKPLATKPKSDDTGKKITISGDIKLPKDEPKKK